MADGGVEELLLPERAIGADRDDAEGVVRGVKGLRVGVDGRATDRDELGADGGREMVRERLGGVNDGLVDRDDTGGRAVEREMLGGVEGRAIDREKLGGDDGLDGGLATLREGALDTLRDGGRETLREGALDTLRDGVDRETLRDGALETLRDGVDRETL